MSDRRRPIMRDPRARRERPAPSQSQNFARSSLPAPAVVPAMSGVTGTELAAPVTPDERMPMPAPSAFDKPAMTFARRRPSFDLVGWLRGRTFDQWAFAAIFALGAILRFWGLGDKPLHHDESLHAYYSLQFLLNPSGYQYDPLLHGPFQFHIIPIIYIVAGWLHAADNGINDFTVRILPALLGLGMVALPYGLRQHLGRWGALAAALLLAVSPSFVYYSRFVRDDIYVTFFTLLLVVAAIQYSLTRRLGWLVTAVAALTLSYTAMENTFFVIAIFGSYLLAVVLWDLGPIIGARFGGTFKQQDQTLAGRVIALAPFAIVMGALALVGLHWLNALSTTINTLAAAHTGASDPLNPDVTVQHYELIAFVALLALSIAVAVAVIVGLIFQATGSSDDLLALRGGQRWRDHIDPRRMPVLDTLLSTHWIRWFVGFIVFWVIFAAFFWQIPANAGDLTAWGQGFQTGIGRGLLQGIYYWLEQQQVARGGQPWYYYLILIPLYEPLILVFGLAGLVRSLIQPTRFRLFLVYWFVANLVLYSWAGEKMPWLVIHILLPLVLLAGVAFDWLIRTVVRGVQGWWSPSKALLAVGGSAAVVGFATLTVPTAMAFAIALSVAAIAFIGFAATLEAVSRRRMRRLADLRELRDLAPEPRWAVSVSHVGAVGTLLLALALLVPTVWNMQRVSFYEPSVAPNEMLVYVQTTTDVQLVMNKINALDQKLYGGKHLLKIGVTSGAVWPFAWYLRDYGSDYVPGQHAWTRGAIFNYAAGELGVTPDVILGDLDGGSQTVQSFYATKFVGQQYRLRWWWDESYKPPICGPARQTQCVEPNSPEAWGTGVGPLLWISYGAFPPNACKQITLPTCSPVNAQPNGAAAAQRYWNWLWQRQNISGTLPGSTDFMFFVRSDLTHDVQP